MLSAFNTGVETALGHKLVYFDCLVAWLE